MKTLTSLRVTDLVKSFTLFFVGTTAIWALGNYIAIRDVLVSWPVFVANLALSAGLGWWYYRHRYHTVFSYDAVGFELREGQRHTARRWSEFSAVSLIHRGHGELAVRLYEPEGVQAATVKYVELPASTFRLDAQQFRFEVMLLIGGTSGGLRQT